MFEEKAQSYRVKDKEIYHVKLVCHNTQLTKGTIMLLYFFFFFLFFFFFGIMRTLSMLDKYRANVLGPCRARAITLFTVFPWRVTYRVGCIYGENVSQIHKTKSTCKAHIIIDFALHTMWI